MNRIGNPGEYHATLQASGKRINYAIHDRKGTVIVTGWREGTLQDVGDYLKRTIIKRYNAGPDALAGAYFNTETQHDETREIYNVATA